MKIYYWRGKGLVSWIVRHATASPWDHVAIGVTLDGLECYLESLPRTGVRLVPLALDPPDAYQDADGTWQPGQLAHVLALLGEPYSVLDAIRAAFGLRPRHRGLECAELAAKVLGLEIVPTPQILAEYVERVTRNPVRCL